MRLATDMKNNNLSSVLLSLQPLGPYRHTDCRLQHLPPKRRKPMD